VRCGQLSRVLPTSGQPTKTKALAEAGLSTSAAQRNLSKSQQAMALAMIYPEPYTRNQKIKTLRHSIELAQDVLHRGTHFDVALRQVREAEQARKAHSASALWRSDQSSQPHAGIMRPRPTSGTTSQ
jgi:DNA-binding transcriptional regulator YiaG